MADDKVIGAHALRAAEELSGQILADIEAGTALLENIALRAARLADLLGDVRASRALRLEVSGYPARTGGLSPEDWASATWAGRVGEHVDPTTKKTSQVAYLESIGELEGQARTSEAVLKAPAATTWTLVEKSALATANRRLGRSRALVHRYASEVHNTLRFSRIGEDVFARLRARVDERIRVRMPDAATKFVSVYDRLASENPEDWSGAVHSCRRILQELADIVFPPTDSVRRKQAGTQEIEIQLGATHYKNRLKAFVEDHADSESFREVVGDHLEHLFDRMDSIYDATSKGTHGNVSKDEADRYVVLTYLLIGEILSLEPPADGREKGRSGEA